MMTQRMFALAEDRRNLLAVGVGTALCVAMVWIGLKYPSWLPVAKSTPLPAELLTGRDSTAQTAPTLHPFGELFKLAAAAGMGMLVTAVQKRFHRDKPLTRSMEHAQILLCVAGALVLILVGDSVARAFSIAGAASIIRFRTPIEDPKDTIILLLLVGLGMACGVGAIAVAGLGTAFLCAVLVLLDRLGEQKPRSFLLVLSSDSSEFPTSHVQNLLAAYNVRFEPREVSKSTVKYLVTLGPDVPLEYLSDQLLSGGYAGIKSVTWEAPKKSV